RRQLLTTRNVRPGVVVDLLFGGLNYQIEHHLFPAMPRPHLRRARDIVRRFCREHDLPYRESGIGSVYAEVLAGLHRAAAPLRRTTSLARRPDGARPPGLTERDLCNPDGLLAEVPFAAVEVQLPEAKKRLRISRRGDGRSVPRKRLRPASQRRDVM